MPAITPQVIAPDSTAMHIATKLARHFVGDTPLQKLVENLANVFLNERGNLASVYRALIAAREAWEPQPAKFKSPWEWLISSLRGLGRKNLNGLNIAPVMNQLGQPVWRPASPAGYDDMAESWAAPNALLRRVELAGGQTVYPKTSIGELGWIAEFEDSEGNCIALSQK